MLKIHNIHNKDMKKIKSLITNINLIFSSSYKVLNYTFKKKIKILFFLMTIGILFEFINLAILLPVLTLIISEQNNEIFNHFIIFDIKSKSDLLIYFLTLFFIIFFIRTIFLVYLNWKKNDFATQLKINLADDFFRIYLGKPYLQQINKNTSIFLRNILTETHNFCSGIVISLLDFILEIGVFLAVLVFLFIYDPKLTFICLFIFGFIALIYLYIASIYTKKIAIDRFETESQRLKILTETSRLIREIIIFAKLDFFYKQFNRYNKKFHIATRNIGLIQSNIRFIFESVIILTIYLFILIYLYFFDYSFNELLLTLGILTAVLFKIAPCAQKIISSSNIIIYSKPSLDVVINSLDDLRNSYKFKENSVNLKEDNSTKGFKKFNFKNVSFSYPDADNSVIKNLSIEFKNYGLIGIYGKSGSGKTTFADLICGLIKPDSGSILADDKSISENLKNWQSHVSYISQSIYLFDDTIKKNITFADDILNKDDEIKLNQAIEQSKVKEFIEESKLGLNTNVGDVGVKLSGGQIQRIGIARSLYKNSNLLILDEPTANLDEKNTISIINDIKNLSKTKLIFLITHDQKLLDYCDKKIIFEKNNFNLV